MNGLHLTAHVGSAECATRRQRAPRDRFRRRPAAAGLAALALLLAAGAARAEEPLEMMVELKLDGRTIEGMPLTWSRQVVRLLGRDGRLWEIPPQKATDVRQTGDRFRGYSVSQLRAELLRELGRDYEVSGTGHYLVAHPRGQEDRWAGRFEDLYRSLVHYFAVRGFQLEEPRFPLLAIVCKDRREYGLYAARHGAGALAGVAGYYATDTNRIALYDRGEAVDSDDWRQNASVIIHEATHQAAFNTGIHNRYAPPPKWLAEGLATMFEAPGVHDGRNHRQLADRINRQRLDDFRGLVVPRHRPELLRSLVASDELFRTDPALAYAEAWALTFYLIETRPRRYAAYVARTGDKPPFADVTAAGRTADFTAVFGDDWPMLEARLLRFMADSR